MEQGLANSLMENVEDSLDSLRKRIPVNIRTFAGTLANDTSPIDEKNFSDKDLEVLGEIYRKKKQSRSEELKGIQDILENYRNTGTELAWKSVNGSLVDDSKAELERLRKKAESLKSDKFPITYKDYPTTSEDSGWVDQIKASFTDPKYRIATTLGQFTASEDGKGNVILEDRYDWTSPENTTASEYLKSIPAALNSPERLGNLAIRAFKPKVAREVRIVIPKGE